MVPYLLTKLATSSMCCKIRPIHYVLNTILINIDPVIPELLFQNVFFFCCHFNDDLVLFKLSNCTMKLYPENKIV